MKLKKLTHDDILKLASGNSLEQVNGCRTSAGSPTIVFKGGGFSHSRDMSKPPL